MAPEPDTSISELVEAMEIMAKAVGAHAICKDKYGRVRVEFPKLPDSEERGWERIHRRIDELVDERASERLQKAEERARVAVGREKALKRALDALWAVLKRFLGKDDFEVVKSDHEAELSKPVQKLDLRGPSPF